MAPSVFEDRVKRRGARATVVHLGTAAMLQQVTNASLVRQRPFLALNTLQKVDLESFSQERNCASCRKAGLARQRS